MTAASAQGAPRPGGRPEPQAAGPGPRQAGSGRSASSPIAYLVLTAGLVLMVGPFLWMILGSFKPQADFLRTRQVQFGQGGH